MDERKIKQVASQKAKPAMTRLKEMPAEVHAKVMEILDKHTYTDAEPLVEGLVGFFCTTNVLCRFRKWQEAIKAMDVGHERIRQIAAFLHEQMPDVSPEKIRELGTAFYAMMFLGNDDAKGFVRVSKMGMQSERELLRVKKLNLEERKFQESLRKKLDAGFDALTKVFQKHPEANRLFEQAREIVMRET